mgnify:CR=1 FL=1
MIAYIVRRLFSTIVVMAVVAFVVFSLLYLTPGDPAAVIAGDIATDEDIRLHSRPARPRRPVPGAIRALAVVAGARRSGHVDLHQSSGHAAHRLSASSRRCR